MTASLRLLGFGANFDEYGRCQCYPTLDRRSLDKTQSTDSVPVATGQCALCLYSVYLSACVGQVPGQKSQSGNTEDPGVSFS